MKTTALAPWFGSKRTLAPEIVKLLGKHRSYWGLCCGSLAVELAKDPCPNETVCDLHGDLTNLAWVLQKESTAVELYARLARTLPSEENFLASQRAILAAADWDDDAPNVDRAFHYFFNSWMGRSGMAGTCRGNSQISVRWTANGGSPAVRFRSAIESIPDWHHRLAYFLILRRNVFDVARSIEDEPGTSIYCDPPYLFRTRKSNDNRVGGAGRYRHEFTEDDHVALAAALTRFKKARVVVSYYADPMLTDLYPGWEQLNFTRLKNLSTQGRRGAVKQTAPEVILVNRLDAETKGRLFP